MRKHLMLFELVLVVPVHINTRNQLLILHGLWWNSWKGSGQMSVSWRHYTPADGLCGVLGLLILFFAFILKAFPFSRVTLLCEEQELFFIQVENFIHNFWENATQCKNNWKIQQGRQQSSHRVAAFLWYKKWATLKCAELIISWRPSRTCCTN